MLFSSQARRRFVDRQSVYPYNTVAKAITPTAIAMNHIKIGSRIVVIAGTARAQDIPGYREPTEQRPTARRIVVIRNGKLVRRRRDQ
jgi:hypothetical protein